MENNYIIGQSAELERVISEDDVYKFAEVSGDYNPIHLDEEYAKSTRFGKKIVHGMLVVSLISKVLGTQLPGKGTIYLGQQIKFLRPVFIGERLQVKVIITKINYEKKILTLDTIVTNDKLKVVVAGEAQVMYE